MRRLIGFFSTTIGHKVVVAVTGLILFLFLVGHVTGNLKAFLPDTRQGVPDIDVYAQFLRTMGVPAVPHGALLWTARTVLLVSLVLHVVLVARLWRTNRNARPVGYARQQFTSASHAARTMMVTGLIVLAFIVFHILHFTVGGLPLGDFRHGQVYSNLFHSFAMIPVAIGYVLAVGVVSVHLYHGVWSLFQTLGLDTPDRNRGLRIIASIAAVGLFLGFSIVPVMFMLGAMGAPPEYSESLLTGMGE